MRIRKNQTIVNYALYYRRSKHLKLLLLMMLSLTTLSAQTNKVLNVNFNVDDFDEILLNAPMERTMNIQSSPSVITLPLPNGGSQDFRVLESPVMEAGLAAQYPNIKSYLIEGDDNKAYHGRLSFTPSGVSASFYSPNGMAFFEPEVDSTIQYMAYYAHQMDFGEFVCGVNTSALPAVALPTPGPVLSAVQSNNVCLSVYQMALATTTGFYSDAGGTLTGANSKLNVILNVLNTLYESENAIRFILCANNDLVQNLSGLDPSLGTGRAGNANTIISGILPDSDYDIGHAVNTQGGSGGVAGQGPCNNGFKARGWTNVNINFSAAVLGTLAHEVGHQFSASHSFYGTDGACGSNRSPGNGYEPGSGNSIMSYEGSCSSQNITPKVQTNYFHIHSLEQINNYKTNTATCGTTIVTTNNPPLVVVPNNTTIPKSTPFYLKGSAADLDGDPLTYNWEQYNTDNTAYSSGDASGNPSSAATIATSPLFRSFDPYAGGSERYFPQLSDVIQGTTTQGEILSSIGRTVNMRLTARDNKSGGGAYTFDEVVLTVDGNSGPFEVTTPNGGNTLTAGSSTTVTWNIAGTNTYCSTVDILLSDNGGYSYPHILASGVTNNGSFSVTIPAGISNTSTARIMVRCGDDPTAYFYDISNSNFSITSSCNIEASAICPSDDISSVVGAANLTLDNHFGGEISSYSFALTSSSLTRDPALDLDWSGVCTPSTSFTNKPYEIAEVVVATTGDYTFNLNGVSSGITIYEASQFNPSNVCSGYIGSSMTLIGGSTGTLSTLTVNLTTCTEYIIVGTYLSGSLPSTLNFSVIGPGNMYLANPSSIATNAYTYVAVDNMNNQITGEDANSDFSSLPVGNYSVYGVSYDNTLTPNNWIGGTINSVGASNCLLFSENSFNLSITPASGCNITNAIAANFSCDNNNTNSTTSDDYITFSLSATNPGTSTTYNVSVSSGSITPTSGTYGTITSFNLQSGSIGAGNVIVTLTDAIEGTCQTTVNVIDPGVHCSVSCTYTSTGYTGSSCQDNGTINNTGDDYITFTLDPVGTNLSNEYTVSVSSGTITPTTATYGSSTIFQLQNGSAGNGSVTVTISDGTDGSCTDNITITDPGTCSACSVDAVSIDPTTAVSATEGSATLNLSLLPTYGNATSSFTGILESSDPSSNLVVFYTPTSGCITTGGTSNYDVYPFYVNTAGTYTFTNTSNTSDLIMNLYSNTYTSSSGCNNWLTGNTSLNTTFTNDNFISVTLAPGTYELVVSTTGSSSTLPYTITPSGGNLYDDTPPLITPYTYTYVVVDGTSNIVAFEQNSDLSNSTTFPAGTYTVYGLAYDSGENLTTYIGNSLTNLTSNIACGDLSSNSVTVTITAAPSCTPPVISLVTPTPITCAGGGEINITATGSSALEYSIDNGVNFQTSNIFTGLSAGTYQVVVRLANDHTCTASPLTDPTITDNTNTISISNSNTNVTCNGGSDGSIQVTPSGGTSPYTYTWSGGLSGATVNGLSAGTYGLTVTDNVGCTGVATFTITEPSAITASVNTTDETVSGANDGTATVTPVGGTAPYTYNWFNGHTGAQVTGLTAGTYNVTITDVNGCTHVESGTVTTTNTSCFSINMVKQDPSCFGDLGGANAAPISTNGPFTFAWDDPLSQTGATASNLAPGTYTVTITDNSGCSETSSVTIVEPPLLTTTVTKIDETANGANDGSAVANVTGGTPPYSYGWSTLETTASIANLVPGLYDVTVTDANACQNVETFVINSASCGSASLVFSAIEPLCNGGTGTILAMAFGYTSPISYTWSSGETTQSVANKLPGSYSVTVTDAVGCTGTASGVMTEPAVLSGFVSTTSETTTGASDGTATVVGIDGTHPYTYNWFNGHTGAQVTGLTAGTYNVTITDVNGCTHVESGVVTTTNTSCFSINMVKQDPPCFGDLGSATASVTGGTSPYTYAWDDPLSQTGATASNLAPGTYTVTITDNSGCSETSSVTIVEPPLLTTNLTKVDETVSGANDGSAVANVTGGTPPYSYGWSTLGTTSSIANLAPGTYSLTVTDANACQNVETFVINSANCGSDIDFVYTNPPTCAVPGGIIQVITFGSATNFEFSINGGQTYQTSQTFYNVTGGSYDVQIRDINTNCITTYVSNPIVFTGAQALPTVLDPTVTQPCITVANPNPTGGSIVMNVSGAVSPLEYSIDFGANYQASSVFDGLPAGNNSLRVRYTNDPTCVSSYPSNPVTIYAPAAAPTINTPILIDQPDCNTPTGTIYVDSPDPTALRSVDNGVTYTYSNMFSGLAPGDYYIKVKSSTNGCEQAYAGNPVTIAPTPITISSVVASPSSCNSGSIDITATGNGTLEYSIDNGITYHSNNLFTGLLGGSYNVRVRPVSDPTCNLAYANNPVIVTAASSSPTISSVSLTQPNCNIPLGIIDITATGSGALEYSIDDGASYHTSNVFSNLNPGTYDIRVRPVTDPTCETIYANNSVTINAYSGNDIVSVVAHKPSCATPVVGTPLIQITANGPESDFEFSIDGGVTYQALRTFLNLSSGTYNITVRNLITNCVSVYANNPVEFPGVQALPTMQPATVTQPCITTANPNPNGGSIILNVTGAVSPLEYSVDGGATYQTSNVFTGLPAGGYGPRVRYINDNTCVRTYPYTSITIYAPGTAPTINTPILIDQPDCNTPTGTIYVDSPDPTALRSVDNGVTYTYSNMFSGLAPGDYYIKVKSSTNGCERAYAGNPVTIAPPPLPSISSVVASSPNCNTTTGQIDITATSVGGALEYSINNGQSYQSTNTFTNLTPGTYTVKVRPSGDPNCDLAYANNPVTISPAPPALSVNTTTTDENSAGACDGTATATVSNGTSPYTYSWSNGNNTATATGLCNGTHTVMITDATGCTVTETVTVSTTSVPWPVTQTPNNHTIIVMPTITSFLNGATLQVGDYIGFFYENGGTLQCAGYHIWTGNALSFPVYGDDFTTTQKEGFAVGEEFRVKVLQATTGLEITIQPTFAPINLPLITNTNTFANNGVSQLDDVHSGPWIVNPTSVIHTVDVLSSVSNNINGSTLQIGDYIGFFYEDGGTLHPAGSAQWTGSDLSIPVYGDDPSTPTKDGLGTGEVFKVKVWQAINQQEYITQATYAPVNPPTITHTSTFASGGISQIDDLTAGPWPVTQTNQHHSINVLGSMPNTINGTTLQVGDYIGFFYEDNGTLHCAGSGVWTGNNTAITVYGDDNTTTAKDGMAVGEIFKVKVWQALTLQETSVIATYAPVNPPLVTHTDAFAIDGISQLNDLTSDPWTVTVTTDIHTITVPSTMTSNLNGISLQINDYIGFFYEDNGNLHAAGFGQWTGNNLNISVYGDDVATGIKDGMAIGEVFKVKVWQAATQTELDVHATYSPITLPTVTHTNTFAVGGLSKLDDVTAVTVFDLQLHAGWQLISSYVTPSLSDLDILCQDINPNVIILKDGLGNPYLPSLAINNIGNWATEQGYEINMSTADVLTFTGLKVNPTTTPINLPLGWSITAYLRDTPIPIEQALANIVNDIILVKDDQGGTYIPSLTINSIGNMEPGEGYDIKMSSNTTLNYPAFTGPATSVDNNNGLTPTAHYVKPTNTGQNATVVILNSAVSDLLTIGDEIGIYSQDGILCGAGVYEGQNFAISVWGDDPTTNVKDGMASGEVYLIKYWDKETNKERTIYNVRFENGTALYTDNAFAIIKLLDLSTTTTTVSNLNYLSCFPNPAKDQVTFVLELEKTSKVSLKLINVHGQEIEVITNQRFVDGRHTVEFDATRLMNGLYLYQLQTEEGIITKKLMIQK